MSAPRVVPSVADPGGLSQIVEGNPVATIVIDASHRVVLWNRACAVLTGVPAEEVIGTGDHWRAFYPTRRPILADLIVDGASEADIDRYYHGKFGPSALIDGAFEAEDFFPGFAEGGKWLFFTAAPLRDGAGRVAGAIETLQDVTLHHRTEEALKASEERYRILSVTDALTGLYNSRHFYERLAVEIERAERYRRPLSLAILDADNFKRVNDTYGHLEGDRVLQILAGKICECLRRTDSAYRYGGEEFVILMPEAPIDAAMLVAERLRRSFAETPICPRDGETITCTISIGVTQYCPGEGGKNLVRRADDGAYQAKRQGKNCVVAV